MHTNSPWLCVIKVCSNGGAAYINSKLLAKANLNIEIVMQTFENLILHNCSQNSMILHTHGPWVCVIIVCSNGGATLTRVCVIKVCSSGYNNIVKLHNTTIIVHYNIEQVNIRSVSLVYFITNTRRPQYFPYLSQTYCQF